MPVLVFIKGGLGNQLYQYYAAKQISHDLATSLSISTVFLPSEQDTFQGVSRWPMQISDIIPSEISVGQRFQPFGKTSLRSKLSTQLFRCDSLVNSIFPPLKLVTDKNYRELQSSLKKHQYILMNGTFSSNPNLLPMRHEIRKEILSNVKLAQTSMQNSELSLGIHIRLGDHLELGIVQPETLKIFLSKALSSIDLKQVNRITLFSDDEDFAKNMLPKHTIGRVETCNPSMTALETLANLASHDIIIGGRSTFFWWASFLQGEGGEAILPKGLRVIYLDNHKKV